MVQQGTAAVARIDGSVSLYIGRGCPTFVAQAAIQCTDNAGGDRLTIAQSIASGPPLSKAAAATFDTSIPYWAAESEVLAKLVSISVPEAELSVKTMFASAGNSRLTL